MKVLKEVGVAIAVSIAVSACSSDKPSGPGTSPEVGSNSLQVVADINGSDVGGGLFTTSFQVVVSDSFSAPVNDANVTISHSQVGVLNLVWDSITPGTYTAAVANYNQGTYTLNVVRGTDSLTNGRVYAPDIHTFLFPTLTDTLRQDTSFTVLWSRGFAADEIQIETRDFGPLLITGTVADNGSYLIPASFTPRTDQRIRIWRGNSTVLTTGRAGSDFEAEIRNSIEPIVVQ